MSKEEEGKLEGGGVDATKKKKKKKLSKVEKLAAAAKKRKKKRKGGLLDEGEDDEETEPERGIIAWMKYMAGLTGGILYVNKWLESGGRYEGSWHGAARCPHRHGIMTYVDGEVYEGRWRLGVRHGWGGQVY